MNCPNVIVFVKYAFPRQIAETVFTNSTRLRSRASARSSWGRGGAFREFYLTRRRLPPAKHLLGGALPFGSQGNAND